MMRELYVRFGGDKTQCVAAYSAAEQRGEVLRESDEYHIPPETYASGLFEDGIRKRWLLEG
jgi:hypothetical protein